MRININILKVPRFQGILFAMLLSWNLLPGQNDALHFDGTNDFITLDPISGFAPNSDFTVEMWFYSTATGGNGTCFGDFRRLFSMGATGPNRFEVGECNGTLSAFLGTGVVQSAINIRDNQWHCISVIRLGGNIDIYLDGNPVSGLTGLAAGGFVATFFRVGHWPGGFLTPGQDWLGFVDEVKLWNIALQPSQFTACNACVLTGQESGLIAYWRFDEWMANGSNNISPLVNTAQDYSSGVNIGILTSNPSTAGGFLLNGTMSNFVPSTSPLLYPEYTNSIVFVSDPLQTIGLTSICSGYPVHFSIYSGLAGNLAQAGAGTSVVWEYSDDCFNTAGIPITPELPPSAVFSGFSFVSPPGHLATSVPLSTNAYVDRGYRAIITVTDGTNTCTYTTDPFCSLRICSPVQNASLSISPSPIAPATTFCEGDVVQFNVTLSSNMPPPDPSNNNVKIDWCVIDGGVTMPLTGPAYDDQISITYSGPPLTQPNICFKATISNCSCPPVTVQQCITVDPKPVCGTITGASLPATLMPDPDLDPDHYLICPGDDAAVEVALPFTNCNKVWQYMFTSGSSAGVWKDLGTSNTTQNTNVLPHLKPASSPYLWPPGETCINYRIECRPYNYPNSGCPPCYSNVVRICLKQAPPAPVITAVPNPICKGDISLLSVPNPDTNCIYEWYCNGLPVGVGGSFNASQQACYWVTCNYGCFTVASNKVCLNVCEVVAVISCPLPVCPCVGDTITLSAVKSSSTCGGMLTYMWSWDSGTLVADNGVTLVHIPDAAGTTYTLTVTDTNGCTHTTQTTIKPCSI